jgi:hypothetical protein
VALRHHATTNVASGAPVSAVLEPGEGMGTTNDAVTVCRPACLLRPEAQAALRGDCLLLPPCSLLDEQRVTAVTAATFEETRTSQSHNALTVARSLVSRGSSLRDGVIAAADSPRRAGAAGYVRESGTPRNTLALA